MEKRTSQNSSPPAKFKLVQEKRLMMSSGLFDLDLNSLETDEMPSEARLSMSTRESLTSKKNPNREYTDENIQMGNDI